MNAAVMSMNASDSRNAAAAMCSSLLFIFNASFALNEPLAVASGAIQCRGDVAMDVLVYTNVSAALNDTVVMNDPVALNDRFPLEC